MKHPEIILDGLQVKSLKKAKKLAKALNVIEEECGIKQVRITLKNMFICPRINLKKLQDTDMERLLRDIIYKLK